jgi:hypothetical protein
MYVQGPIDSFVPSNVSGEGTTHPPRVRRTLKRLVLLSVSSFRILFRNLKWLRSCLGSGPFRYIRIARIGQKLIELDVPHCRASGCPNLSVSILPGEPFW